MIAVPRLGFELLLRGGEKLEVIIYGEEELTQVRTAFLSLSECANRCARALAAGSGR